MTTDALLRLGQEALMIVLLLSAPAVLTALVVSLGLSVLQAATQIQDQTLGVVAKLVCVYLVLAVGGFWLAGQMVRFTVSLFENIREVAT